MMIALLLFDLSPRAPLLVTAVGRDEIFKYCVAVLQCTGRLSAAGADEAEGSKCVPLLCLSIDDDADCASDENAGMKKKKNYAYNNDCR